MGHRNEILLVAEEHDCASETLILGIIIITTWFCTIFHLRGVSGVGFPVRQGVFDTFVFIFIPRLSQHHHLVSQWELKTTLNIPIVRGD